MFLEADAFRSIVASTPLVSIDLIVQNQSDEILLGQRLNRPAQGCWFVPGGRIYKNENLDAAFRRLTETELGQTFCRESATLLGIFEHFYSDSVFGDTPDTHYVVVAYALKLSSGSELQPPAIQHDLYRWWSRPDMLASDEVHVHTKAYIA
ncbi:GDP-mannose mannosyl hydrolase [Pseudomonas profundi]|uniref:GDP-mannose mannosyl hydrolase n=1 Tax=Pseudomonas profundi TaxID=1981513 RepID=UPI001238A390|nr:GDP-mannose mannosyl hydrolase [Pseudomonas profundi]